MTEQTPPPPPPPPPPSGPSGPPPPPPESVDPAATVVAPAAAETSTGSGAGKKAIIGGIAAAVVLGGGYGAYAVYDKLDGGGAQPHDVMPASTQFYARVDLDPSASQKIELFKLIRKFPDLADEIGIKNEGQDIRELIFDAALESCDGVTYEDDVKPWLGDRVGIGGELEGEKVVIAVQTTDEGKSREGIKKLFGCGDDEYGIAYLDGYAILAPKQADVDAAVKATAKASLGDSETFTTDFEELGGEGIASAWINVEAIADSPQASDFLGPEADQLKKAGSVATTLRVDGNALELAVLGGLEQLGDDQPISLAKLPADTVAALSVAGLGDQVSEGFDALVEGFDAGFASGFASPPQALDAEPGPGDGDDLDGLSSGDDFSGSLDSGEAYDAQDFIDQIEQETGFKLPEDLETLFGDSLTLAIGAKNLETLPTMSGPDGFTALDVALSLTSDKTKALDLVQRISSLASDAGIPLIAAPTDDGAVLATNQGAADAITDPDGNLGDEKSFQEVIPDGDSTYGGLYVNMGAILDKLLEADPPEEIRSGIEEAKALSAVGFSVSSKKGDRSLVSLRVSFK